MLSGCSAVPRLNIAMPNPASESIEMEPLTIDGISICHLHSMEKTGQPFQIAQLETEIAQLGTETRWVTYKRRGTR